MRVSKKESLAVNAQGDYLLHSLIVSLCEFQRSYKGASWKVSARSQKLLQLN